MPGDRLLQVRADRESADDDVGRREPAKVMQF